MNLTILLKKDDYQSQCFTVKQQILKVGENVKIPEAGRIRSVGVSNYESYHIDEIKSYGKSMPVANQVYCNYRNHFFLFKFNYFRSNITRTSPEISSRSTATRIRFSSRYLIKFHILSAKRAGNIALLFKTRYINETCIIFIVYILGLLILSSSGTRPDRGSYRRWGMVILKITVTLDTVILGILQATVIF